MRSSTPSGRVDLPAQWPYQQAIRQHNWQSWGIEYVHLRLADRNVWLQTANAFADHNATPTNAWIWR